MTALAIYQGADAAHVVMDGTVSTPDGEIYGLTNKPILLPHLAAILAPSGSLHFAWAAGLVAAGRHPTGDFDTLADDLPEIARMAADNATNYATTGVTPTGDDTRAVLAAVGWSRQLDGPATVMTWTHDHWRDNPDFGPAYTLKRLPAETRGLCFATPMDEHVVAEVERQGMELWAPENTAEREGLILARAQRHYRSEGEAALGLGCTVRIGGFAQIATVTRDGLSTRILERWPDKPGDRPGPLSA